MSVWPTDANKLSPGGAGALPAADLRARLREALGGRTLAARPIVATAVAPARPTAEPELHQLMPGFWQDTAAGRVFVVEQRYELEHKHGRFALGRAAETPLHLWARLGREPALADVDPRRVVFLDTETTGLAGGSGTLAFLVGIGHFLDGHFRLRQYFLSDLGQEPALLRALADYLDDFEAIVTFNGKTFDLPLLTTRLVMARQRATFTDLPHLDLLHPSRRLYRDRLESCRLETLERRLLGLERHEDVPGWEIPSLYFRYMRTRRLRPMLAVLEHNALDVLSMVTLTFHLARLFGGEARLNGADRLALGRACEADGRHTEAAAHYEAALDLDLRQVEQEQCEQRLSLLYKKLGRLAEAAFLWETVATRPGNRQLYPLIELAKHHERVTRDLEQARLITERALLLLDRYHARMGYAGLASERAALTQRLARLDDRAARQRAQAQRPTRRRTVTRAD